jgi:hypothetical protein
MSYENILGMYRQVRQVRQGCQKLYCRGKWSGCGETITITAKRYFCISFGKSIDCI